MDLKELEDYISIMLSQLRVTSKKLNLIRGISTQFVIEDFGLIICGINRVDYTQVNDTIIKNFPDWRIVYITTTDNVAEKKMRCCGI
jgi:hypothetical protein